MTQIHRPLRVSEISAIALVAVGAFSPAAAGLSWLWQMKTDIAVLKTEVAEIRAYIKLDHAARHLPDDASVNDGVYHADTPTGK